MILDMVLPVFAVSRVFAGKSPPIVLQSNTGKNAWLRCFVSKMLLYCSAS